MDLNSVLNPAYLSSLKGLALKARMVLEGTMAGRHLSPFHGFSSEFSQYKGYVPGDDIKFLDWKVYGRNDQLVTRQYRDETNASVYLVLDSSESMGYSGGDGVSKLEYATVLAASLALMAFGQRDAVSVAHGAGEPASFLPPRNNAAHLRQALQALESLRPGGVTDLEALFGRMAARLKSGSMTFLFTDLWQDPKAIVTGLKEIRFKNQAATLVQILAPAETAFLDGTNLELVDMETKETVKISARHLKPQYLETLAAHTEALRSECFNLNVKFLRVETTLPYFQAMRLLLQRP
ncbi:MAG TPA: DUF58 domain-containing protein [Fibrobacteria bacterium]|nr:DUF58 domain-containing protein [Fibrobacteria bacterium]